MVFVIEPRAPPVMLYIAATVKVKTVNREGLKRTIFDTNDARVLYSEVSADVKKEGYMRFE